ncbi:MAG TPA: TIGR03118 family protein, partial [Puia sp.]
MKKFTPSNAWLKPDKICLLFIFCLVFCLGCRKSNVNNKDLRDFQQVNLVANSAAYAPALVDPTLQNAWGLAWAPSGIAWVNAQNDHVSELYTGEGVIVRPPVNIPSPTDTIGGSPTGIVFSGGAGFTLSNKVAPNFLFIGDDGVLSGWNGAAGNNALRIGNNPAPSSYTGLALATVSGRHYLYGANFGSRRIDVWDTTFTKVSMPFHDPAMPSGYSPFNIQSVGSW